MFFRAADYFSLVERVAARGVDLPILPGIMPILNLNAISRQGELIGTEAVTASEALALVRSLDFQDPAAAATAIRVLLIATVALAAGAGHHSRLCCTPGRVATCSTWPAASAVRLYSHSRQASSHRRARGVGMGVSAFKQSGARVGRKVLLYQRFAGRP